MTIETNDPATQVRIAEGVARIEAILAKIGTPDEKDEPALTAPPLTREKARRIARLLSGGDGR